jgi:hypothetical protein
MKLLDEMEAAEYLRLEVSTLRWWRWRDLGPRFLKMGRKPVYDQADLDLYIESIRSKSRSPDL